MVISRAISLQKELNEKVRIHCKNNGTTVNEFVVFLLNKYLLEEQDGARRGTNILRQED